MRSRLPLLALLATLGSFALPLFAHATGIPYFGPVVPSNAATCAAGWQSLIQLINNAVAVGITIVLLFIAPIMIAYAGFLYVVNPVNPSGRSQANKMMLNVVTGIVISLAAWLIVDAVLTTLTNQGGLNVWTAGMFGDGTTPCLITDASLNTFNQSTGQTVTSASANSAALSGTGVGSCDPIEVGVGASNGGYATTAAEDQALACIARYESSCGTKNPPYNLNSSWNTPIASAGGKASTAAGAFQVLLASNHTCYDNNACDAAVNLPPGTPLNCNKAFTSLGLPIDGPALQQCEQAAGNVACSSAAAACLLTQQTFLKAYAADSYAQSCASQAGYSG